MQDEQHRYMEQALAEAKKGLGRTSPNPAVGAIIVREGRVVGRGYHQKAGTPHAEVHAIANALGQTEGATMYVTLEPCNHTGRTPPCTQAILQSGIRTVVIGMADPNPRVAGGGAAYLAAHGITVVVGVLEGQCRALNYPFIKHSSTGLPWVMLKAGLSLDGKITLESGKAAAITGPETKRMVHQLRNQVDAILIGVETAIIDNPQLTTRLDGEDSRDPLRVILDSSLRLPPTARMLHQQSAAQTWVLAGMQADPQRVVALEAAGARVWRLPFDGNGRIELAAVLQLLGAENITSVLVEGGARVHGSFYRQQLVDELLFFYAPFLVGDSGTPLLKGYELAAGAQAPELLEPTVEFLGRDILLRARVQH